MVGITVFESEYVHDIALCSGANSVFFGLGI